MKPDFLFVYGTHTAHKTSRMFAESVTDRSFSVPYNWDSTISTAFAMVKAIWYAFSMPKYPAYLVSNPIALWAVCLKKWLFQRDAFIVHRVNDSIYDRESHSSWKHKLFQKMASAVDLFVSCSSLITESILRVRPNADIELVEEFLLDSSYLETQPDLWSNNFLLIGSLEKTDCKGVGVAAKALARFHQESRVESVLYVLGRSHNQELEKSLKKYEFIWLEGFQDPRNYVGKCSFYIQPGSFDAASNSVMEAMAAGLIPIVTSSVGNSFLVKKVAPELVCESQSVARVIDAIVWAQTLSLAERKKLSQRCKDIVRPFSAKNQLAKFRRILRSRI